jgi:hypothetical protein
MLAQDRGELRLVTRHDTARSQPLQQCVTRGPNLLDGAVGEPHLAPARLPRAADDGASPSSPIATMSARRWRCKSKTSMYMAHTPSRLSRSRGPRQDSASPTRRQSPPRTVGQSHTKEPRDGACAYHRCRLGFGSAALCSAPAGRICVGPWRLALMDRIGRGASCTLGTLTTPADRRAAGVAQGDLGTLFDESPS